MKTRFLLIISTILSIAACTKENLTENTTGETTNVVITGNSMNGFYNDESRASTISNIPEDESILFYSTGGIKADGDILEYNEGVWTGLKDNKWHMDEGEAHIMAYYPVINNDNLYDTNGELKDLVYCKTTAQPGESINLTFSHIFSKIVFNIEKGLNDTIKQINVNIPLKIDNFDLYTGEYSFHENQNGNISFERNETGVYEFFVPASDNMTVSFEIVCPNISQTSTIGNTIYNAGYEYVCNISKRTSKGIYTKEDFIAFTHLINGETEYNGIKLEDLYVLENGVRVFNLYKDLNFTDKESALIRRIADRGKEFNDVFDGNNHSINNLTLPLNNVYAYIGLFERTSVNSHIKNLTLANCKITDNKDEYCALLTGSNKGIIENCHIIGGSITNTKNVRFAGFTYYNAGYLVNCSISGFNIGNTYGTLGCLTHQNDKDIINCRITNDLNRHPEGATSSVTTITNNGNIYNVFVEKYISSLWGVCNVNKRTGQFYNCIIPNYYSSQYIKDNNNPNASPSTGIYFYEYTAEEYQTIADKLNNWIDNEGKNNYPQFTFRRWKTDDSQKVIFE